MTIYFTLMVKLNGVRQQGTRYLSLGYGGMNTLIPPESINTVTKRGIEMRAITVKKGGYEFLILPLNHLHRRFELGDRFELYLKVGNNYLGTERFSATTCFMLEEIDKLIFALNKVKGDRN